MARRSTLRGSTGSHSHSFAAAAAEAAASGLKGGGTSTQRSEGGGTALALLHGVWAGATGAGNGDGVEPPADVSHYNPPHDLLDPIPECDESNKLAVCSWEYADLGEDGEIPFDVGQLTVLQNVPTFAKLYRDPDMAFWGSESDDFTLKTTQVFRNYGTSQTAVSMRATICKHFDEK